MVGRSVGVLLVLLVQCRVCCSCSPDSSCRVMSALLSTAFLGSLLAARARASASGSIPWLARLATGVGWCMFMRFFVSTPRVRG